MYSGFGRIFILILSNEYQKMPMINFSLNKYDVIEMVYYRKKKQKQTKKNLKIKARFCFIGVLSVIKQHLLPIFLLLTLPIFKFL